MTSPPEQVHLPVVVQELVGGDGTRAVGFRVFCPVHEASVGLEVCESCPQCVEVLGDTSAACGAVVCRPQLRRAEGSLREDDSLDLAADAAVGAAIVGSVHAVRDDVALSSLRALIVEKKLSFLFVVDDSQKVVGVIRDIDVLRPSLDALRARPTVDAPGRGIEGGAGDIMSPTLCIREDMPIRRALVQMAASQARQVPVVTADGELVGRLVDVEGLRWLAGHSTSGR
jgi:CBS-domain-containing membrane protein